MVGAAVGPLGDDGHDCERQCDGDGAQAPMRDRQRLRDRGKGGGAWRARVIASLPFPDTRTTKVVSDRLSSIPRLELDGVDGRRQCWRRLRAPTTRPSLRAREDGSQLVL
jgi:hypothetical protein